MRGRLFSLFACLFALSFSLDSAYGANLAQQRQYYDEAKRALAKGDDGPYQRYAAALQDYPLQPYLAYDELTARLKWASNDEIEKFLAEHGDLPQANWMKLRWLRWLAERGDWATFVKYYDPKLNFTELDCLNAQYQISHNLKAEGYANTEKLWLTGKSQPEACDALFGMWAAEGQLTEQKRWERTKLAAQARNYPLANSLVNGLSTLAPRGRLLVDVAQKPELLNQPSRFTPADEPMSDIVSLGLRRLARQSPEDALALLDGYGSTESNFVIGADISEQRPGTMGKVRPGFDARVVDDDDNEVPAGTPGELMLRASEPYAFATGYFGMPEKTVEAWRNLWFHTGDRVVRDADGYFTFMDRLKDAIRRRGENISSYEVEQVLLSHPAVGVAAVFPVKSEMAEDEVMTTIVLREGATLGEIELMQFCEPRLSYFAVPRYVEFLPQLPATENGKIQKFKLRERGVTPGTWDREAAGYQLKR